MPDRRYPFHRYAWISNYGEDTPPGKSALVAEVTVPPGREADLEELKLEVVRGLTELGELRGDEVDVVAWYHEYGYPVYTLTHSGDVAVLERCLRELGVVPLGRWGSWQYWNTDRIFEEAQKLTLWQLAGFKDLCNQFSRALERAGVRVGVFRS